MEIGTWFEDSRMGYEQGIRVGAILSADAESVRLLGYGTYLGDFVPEDDDVGIFGVSFKELGRKNPRILLDSGDVVWGCECWWGPEEKVLKMIGTRRVESVIMHDFRTAPGKG